MHLAVCAESGDRENRTKVAGPHLVVVVRSMEILGDLEALR